ATVGRPEQLQQLAVAVVELRLEGLGRRKPAVDEALPAAHRTPRRATHGARLRGAGARAPLAAAGAHPPDARLGVCVQRYLPVRQSPWCRARSCPAGRPGLTLSHSIRSAE